MGNPVSDNTTQHLQVQAVVTVKAVEAIPYHEVTHAPVDAELNEGVAADLKKLVTDYFTDHGINADNFVSVDVSVEHGLTESVAA
jgi:hypothetical protein